jgi:carbamoyltransferase
MGISDHFTAGAAIVRDGVVVAAINEERLARKKMVMGFPRKSIAAVIQLAGLKAGDIDHVAVASQWGHFLNEYVNFDNGVFGVDEGVVKGLFFSIGSKLSGLRTRAPFLENLYYDLRRPAYAHRRRMTKQVLAKEFGITCPVHFMAHHYSHATAAYFASGFQDALLVSLDGAGDGHSSHVYHVKDGQWHHV